MREYLLADRATKQLMNDLAYVQPNAVLQILHKSEHARFSKFKPTHSQWEHQYQQSILLQSQSQVLTHMHAMQLPNKANAEEYENAATGRRFRANTGVYQRKLEQQLIMVGLLCKRESIVDKLKKAVVDLKSHNQTVPQISAVLGLDLEIIHNVLEEATQPNYGTEKLQAGVPTLPFKFDFCRRRQKFFSKQKIMDLVKQSEGSNFFAKIPQKIVDFLLNPGIAADLKRMHPVELARHVFLLFPFDVELPMLNATTLKHIFLNSDVKLDESRLPVDPFRLQTE